MLTFVTVKVPPLPALELELELELGALLDDDEDDGELLGDAELSRRPVTMT